MYDYDDFEINGREEGNSLHGEGEKHFQRIPNLNSCFHICLPLN